AGGGAGAHGRVGHGAHGQSVDVQVADGAAVVGGQCDYVVSRLVEVHRAAAQQLYTSAGDEYADRLSHWTNHIERQVAGARAHGLTDRQGARLHVQSVATRRSSDLAGGGAGAHGRVGDGAHGQSVDVQIADGATVVGGQRDYVVSRLVE